MSSTCNLCGAPRDAGARFCPACGNRFKEQVDNYDGFISYRREGGSHIAALLKLLLKTGFGKQFFLDVDELQVGRFDEKLLKIIGDSPNFVLVLSSGSLDRCVDKHDWLKREIMHALETKRNIIPLLVDGFTFPGDQVMDLLPDAMHVLPSLQAVSYSHVHRESAIRKIAEYCVDSVGDDRRKDTSHDGPVSRLDESPDRQGDSKAGGQASDPGAADVLLQLGQALMGQRQYSGARDQFAAAISLAPQYGRAHACLGLAYLFLEKAAEAIAEFSVALDLGLTEDQEYYAYLKRGMLYNAVKEPEKSIVDLDKALTYFGAQGDKMPEGAQVEYGGGFLCRGGAHWQLGNRDRALADLDVAVRMLPHSPVPLLNRGHLHRELHNDSAAIQDYESAIRLDPTFREQVPPHYRSGPAELAGRIDNAIKSLDAFSRLAVMKKMTPADQVKVLHDIQAIGFDQGLKDLEFLDRELPADHHLRPLLPPLLLALRSRQPVS